MGVLMRGGKELCPVYVPRKIEENDINFFDYDGTLVASYTLAETQALTELPQAPDHSSDAVPLTFDGWNWTLDEIKALGRPCDIGAHYHPTDGKTHIVSDYDCTTDVQISFGSYSSKAVSIIVDWGDGSVESITGVTTTARVLKHTFSKGRHDTAIECDGEFRVGGTGTDGFQCEQLFLSNNLIQVANYLFRGCRVTTISLGSGLKELSANSLASNYRVSFISIPRTISNLSSNAITACSFKNIAFHPLLTSINNNLYTLTYLRRVSIPQGTTLYPSNAINQVGVQELYIPDTVPIISGLINAYNLRRVEFAGLQTQVVANTFQNCYCLSEIIIPQGWVCNNNIMLSNSPSMSREKLVEFFGKLGNGSATITLGTAMLAKLSDEDRAIATSKGYTLA